MYRKCLQYGHQAWMHDKVRENDKKNTCQRTRGKALPYLAVLPQSNLVLKNCYDNFCCIQISIQPYEISCYLNKCNIKDLKKNVQTLW